MIKKTFTVYEQGVALDHIIDKYTDKYLWPDVDLVQRQKEEQEAWQAQLDRACRVWTLEEECRESSGCKEDI